VASKTVVEFVDQLAIVVVVRQVDYVRGGRGSIVNWYSVYKRPINDTHYFPTNRLSLWPSVPKARDTL
jgi:hypothetical protein